MNQELWTSVDHYFEGALIKPDDALRHAEKTALDEQIPPISVSPALGKFLHLMVKISGAQRILEIGTLAGYSTLWMAKALPGQGKIITLEKNRKCAQIAQLNIDYADYGEKIELMLGTATDSLKTLIAQNTAPFDLIFIDADKENNTKYLELCLQLSRKGTVIIADNIVRNADILDNKTTDKSTKGVIEFNARLAREKNISAVALQTVGIKGYDGFAVILVEDNDARQ